MVSELSEAISQCMSPVRLGMLFPLTSIAVHFNMLRYLKPVFDAYHEPEECCMEETRVELLLKLYQWIEGLDMHFANETEVYAGMY